MLDILNEIASCDECEICLDVCPVYNATSEYQFSPLMRLKTAEKIFNDGEITDTMIKSIYNCPECARCNTICPNDIKISEIVAASRVRLVQKGLAPLEGQSPIINSIKEKGNAVNGDPAKRLDWLPEEFEDKKSDTLLFTGCLPSYAAKDIAQYSYRALKKAGVDFTMLEDEGCCGVYLYDAGMHEEARQLFEKNASRFKELGIKRIITPCAGCYRCYKRYYPELLGEFDFEVVHIIEVFDELIQKGDIKLERGDNELTLHDSCRLGRKEGFFETPRKILNDCSTNIKEIRENRENSLCCGAGAGIRSIYKNLSLEIGKDVLNNAPAETIITTCPFCTFNLRYGIKKTGAEREIKYIAELVAENMK